MTRSPNQSSGFELTGVLDSSFLCQIRLTVSRPPARAPSRPPCLVRRYFMLAMSQVASSIAHDSDRRHGGPCPSAAVRARPPCRCRVAYVWRGPPSYDATRRDPPGAEHESTRATTDTTRARASTRRTNNEQGRIGTRRADGRAVIFHVNCSRLSEPRHVEGRNGTRKERQHQRASIRRGR